MKNVFLVCSQSWSLAWWRGVRFLWLFNQLHWITCLYKWNMTWISFLNVSRNWKLYTRFWYSLDGWRETKSLFNSFRALCRKRLNRYSFANNIGCLVMILWGQWLLYWYLWYAREIDIYLVFFSCALYFSLH